MSIAQITRLWDPCSRSSDHQASHNASELSISPPAGCRTLSTVHSTSNLAAPLSLPWCCALSYTHVRRPSLGSHVLTTGGQGECCASHLILVRLLPPCPCCFHSFQPHSFSTEHRQSLSNTSKQFIDPNLFTTINPVTRSFGKGLGACENATFTLVDDNNHERPPFHIQILRAFSLNKAHRNFDDLSLDSDYRPLADLGTSTFHESEIYWQVKAPPGLFVSLANGTILTYGTPQGFH
jgi:hypothetical protein